MDNRAVTRRAFLKGVGALGSLALAGCLEVSPENRLWRWLEWAEHLNQRVFGAHLGDERRVKTYPASAISKDFRINSLYLPPDYETGVRNGWRDWRLTVGGLVDRPLVLSLEEMLGWPSVTQVTRLDCVEGWSAIGQWTGIRLRDLLDRVSVRSGARYVVCYAADQDELGIPFYGSLDLPSARHPQTLLAYGFNGQVPLPLDHGAPLRLLLPTQLGYKNTKFIHRIELVTEFTTLRGGKGGYWEDQGYEWYAGI